MTQSGMRGGSVPATVGPSLWASAVVAVLAGLLPYLLPGFDAWIPGGAIRWQAAFAVLSGLAAVHAWRGVRAGRTVSARWIRVFAGAGWILAATWALGIGLLWLLWPR